MIWLIRRQWDLHTALSAAAESEKERGVLFAYVFVNCVYRGRVRKGRGIQNVSEGEEPERKELLM